MSLDIYLNSVTCAACGRHDTLGHLNITHNLSAMADAAGIYDALWHPEKANIHYASDLMPVLMEGVTHMKANPEYYKEYNAPNGWGSYDDFIPWLDELIDLCSKHPGALISVSR